LMRQALDAPSASPPLYEIQQTLEHDAAC